ncbi:antA/AntB antirepressor family protein [Paraburkholderia caribensis]|uniref:antA/AntB antirepressor family protein n=1 Tax=Paraburkholderia caribensis TaxID=75105 RepID=UPI0020900DF5|nr:antA/AntB antirepressor family protein [Paraburkholderia caribensis]MCO4880254.1 antA/AntB antirepressor family protein [Paraburkholderia caribensis]
MSNLMNWDPTAFPAINTEQIGGEEMQSVDLRDLHKNMAIATRFADWAARELVDFERGRDYEVFLNSENNPSGGRPAKEYSVTLDAAKHIAMVSRTARGREVRDYFIAVEKQARKQALSLVRMTQSEIVLANAQAIVNMERKHNALVSRVEVLESTRTDSVRAPLAVLPGGMEIKSRAKRRLAKRFGISVGVCEQIFDYHWYQLRTGITVLNPNEEARKAVPACDAFYTKTINDVFNRVMSEVKSVGKMFTHKSVAGRFHVRGGEDVSRPRRQVIELDEAAAMGRVPTAALETSPPAF